MCVMKEMKRVHLVGIGGSGLSAMAMVLLERGVEVSGSDRQLSPLARQVQAAGGRVYIGHAPQHIVGADLVVMSSAIPDDNVEIQAARAAGIPVYKRAGFLNILTAGARTIAVAGTHGKTTTTAMIAWVLTRAGYDPSYIIGGNSLNLGANAHHGGGDFFVIEADEYDRMFLGLSPEIAVVTNIEHDHPDCFPTPDAFYQAFADFAGRISPQGILIACGDDDGAARLLANMSDRPFDRMAYGNKNLDYTYHASNMSVNSLGGYSFQAARQEFKGQQVSVQLAVPGAHNVLNALAALAVADCLGIDWQQAATALAEFRGTGRRFEVRGQAHGVIVVDDYAHHPSEIRATLSAARGRFPGQELWAVWQPHTYSRTRLLQAEFAAAFEQADHVLVTEIYAAREGIPEDGFSAQQVVARMSHRDVHFTPDLKKALAYLLAHLTAGDIVLVLSAGDADALSTDLLGSLARSAEYVKTGS